MRICNELKSKLSKSIQKRINKTKISLKKFKTRRFYDKQIALFLSEDSITQNAKISPPPLLPNKENAKPQIIISLTSYPARIHTLKYTLFTLLTQSLKPDKVVLWLAEDEFRNANKQFNPKKLPKSLLDFSVKGLEIMWYETNIKSYKKLIPSLQQFPDSIIVTADDDNLYDKHWLAKLYSAYEANPSYIHCHRARRIAFDSQNNILPYTHWNLEISAKDYAPSFLNFLTGVGGVLYPPNSLHKDILDRDKFLKLCPDGDDVWFWAMAVLQGTKIAIVPNHCLIKNSPASQKQALWNTNITQNDSQLDNVLKAYPGLRQKILQEKLLQNRLYFRKY